MNFIEEMWYWCAVLYSRFSPFLINHFGIDKLGYFLRKIRRPRILTVGSLRFHMNPAVATSYGMLIGGKFNEEPTHTLLERILADVEKLDLFVDVGANIGEFVIAVGSSEKVRSVIGFEPNSACVASCRESVMLNGLKNVALIQKILADERKAIRFNTSGVDANAHSLFDQPTSGSTILESAMMDDEIQAANAQAIIKIDVEGAELLVLKGGKKFISRNLPLIIFEFNHVSKRHFSLNDVRNTLTQGYEIFRIRSSDGMLDREFEETWNCAAIHRDSPFHKILGELVR